MNKEEEQLQKRLIELSNIAYQRNISTCSDFLNLHELNILHTTPKKMFPIPYETFGGYSYAERQMAIFQPDALYAFEDQRSPADYPIGLLKIRPLHPKFAQALNHRDYLGAILNLGIERCKIGDIIVLQEEAAVFIQEKMVQYIMDSLSRIKHTAVTSELCQSQDFHYTPSYKEIKGTVASVRLDSLLSLAFPLSRSKLTGLIEGAKVYVNGRLITTNSYHVRENDVISVRGMGKLAYKGLLSETKKGRHYVTIHKYI